MAEKSTKPPSVSITPKTLEQIKQIAPYAEGGMSEEQTHEVNGLFGVIRPPQQSGEKAVQDWLEKNRLEQEALKKEEIDQDLEAITGVKRKK